MRTRLNMKIVKFIKNSLIDFPGRIATVVFTNGCNWNCWYCQNKSILSNQIDETDEFFEYLKSRKGWIDGVVICGGEPTIHNDLADFCKRVKALGFDIKLDTNGTNPELIRELIQSKLVDYIAMDVKAPSHKLGSIVCCSNALNKVAETIELLINSEIDYEFRTTVTPDLTLNDIMVISDMIRGARRYYLQQYHKPKNTEIEPEPLPIEVLQDMCVAANRIVPTELR